MAAFLLNDCKYSQQVFSRCLRDLADEGVVRFEHHLGGAVTVSTAGPPPGRALRGYEQVALDRLLARGRPGTSVPLSALVSDDGESFSAFRKRLTQELGAQAGAAGLAKRSSGKGTWPVLLALLVSWVCAAIAVSGINHEADQFIVEGGLYTSLMSLLVPLVRRRWRPTPEGVAAADRWRQQRAAAAPAGPRGRTGGAAQPAPSTTGALSRGGNAPLPRGQAWSSFGGRWHVVSTGPVYRPRGWGTLSALRGVIALMTIGTVFFVFFGLIALAVAARSGRAPGRGPTAPSSKGTAAGSGHPGYG